MLVGNGSRWDCICFADNNYFSWTGRVLGWDECVPYFHRCFFIVFSRESLKTKDTRGRKRSLMPSFFTMQEGITKKIRQLDGMVL